MECKDTRGAQRQLGFHVLVLGLMVWLVGCASRPAAGPVSAVSPASTEAWPADLETPWASAPHMGERVADLALTMVGTPYRFGGASPRGFDCSGLVFYAYDQLGVRVPRTSADQRHASRRVDFDQLQKGDLVFFATSWKSGHVGIYLGGGRFVHAPSSGKRVTVASLETGYYASRVRSAGRLHD